MSNGLKAQFRDSFQDVGSILKAVASFGMGILRSYAACFERYGSTLTSNEQVARFDRPSAKFCWNALASAHNVNTIEVITAALLMFSLICLKGKGCAV